jgi:peptidoglycan/LPS O-acetylase OafA/YrhL
VRLDVQGMRGLAVLAVVVFHAGLPLPGGFAGVDVFFVVSGFVITTVLARELAEQGRLSFGRFYSRRVRRLLPALATVLCFVAVGSALFLSPTGSQQVTARMGVAASLFLANVQIFSSTGGYFDASAEALPLLHTWTLAVEEQFYLVFPALLAAAWWWARRRRRPPRATALLVTSAAACASFAVALPLSLGADRARQLGFYSSPTRAWEFALGAVIALAAPAIGGWPAAVLRLAGWLGLALLAASFALLDGSLPFPGWAALAPVAGAGALIVAGTSRPGPASRLVQARWLTGLGDVSYSWYLWHWPVIVFAASLWPGSSVVRGTAAVVSLLPAWLSYRLVEQPVRASTAVVGWRAVRLGTVCVVVPVTALVGTGLGARRAWGVPAAAELSAQVQPVDAGRARGCLVDMHASSAMGSWSPNRCVWGPAAATGSVYLVGDSNAAMLTEAVTSAAKSVGMRTVVRARSGCPFLDVDLMHDGGAQPGCQELVRSTLTWLRHQPPGVVVVSMATDRYVDDRRHPDFPVWTVRDPETGAVLSQPAAKARVYEAALVRSIRSVEAAGHQVLLVRAIPHFTGWDPRACPLVRTVSDGCGVRVPLARMEAEQSLTRAAEARAITATGVSTIDLRGLLCPHGYCATNQGERWVYRDGTHLSVPESDRLAPEFVDAFERLRQEPRPGSR